MLEGSTSSERAVALPRRPEDVTPEWLTAALRAGGREVTVATVERSGLGEGVGMMSGLERLDVTYSDGDGPAVIIYKFPSTNEANRAVADIFHVYEREVLFYRDVAPHSSAVTPTIFYADIEGTDFVLLMEDLSAYQLGDQVEGCQLAEARAGMEWLGRQHASFWDRADDASFEFLPAVWPSYSSDGLTQGCEIGWDVMVSTFGDVIPEHIRSLKERYLAAAPALFEWMAEAPRTIVHGDFRMDNLFFGTGDQEPLIALDWQGCLRGRGAQDVGYFMSGSIPVELRRAHERELIALWHEQLVANGVTGFSADDAWEHYRWGTLYVWVIAVVIAGTLDPTNARGQRWMSEMLARNVAAIDDLDLIGLLAEIEASAAT